MRRAARKDGSQDEIIDALRRAGISVEVIGKPLDLLLNARFFCPHCRKEIEHGRTALMDCKTDRPTSEGGRHGPTKEQAKFIARWPGLAHFARSPEEAVALAVGAEAMK